MDLFKKKSRIDRLKDTYCLLMKKSFNASLKDKEKSEEVQKEAKKIYEEIQYLSMQLADK